MNELKNSFDLLNCRCDWQHSQGVLLPFVYGENLAAGYGGGNSVAGLIQVRRALLLLSAAIGLLADEVCVPSSSGPMRVGCPNLSAPRRLQTDRL